jgi:anaerobic ribonucleoside-triphosphate reductase activating protein
MNILYTDFTLQDNALDVYVAGCNGSPHCTSCHNPESWNFDWGKSYNKEYFNYIKNTVDIFNTLIKKIRIFGGEPLDQNHNELIHMLFDLKLLNKEIWLFTRYEIDEVPKEIKVFCDFIKTGRYIPELKSDNNIQYGIKLASSNQKIYKLGGLNER